MFFWALSGFQRVVGLPAVGIDFADDLDRPGLHRLADHRFHAFTQEVGVRIAGIALDDGIVAGRFGLHHFGGNDLADADVVEGQVEGAVVFDQAVIADHRDAFVGGLVDGRPDGVLVPGVDDQDSRALRNQRVHVVQLLFRRRLRVRRDIGVA